MTLDCWKCKVALRPGAVTSGSGLRLSVRADKYGGRGVGDSSVIALREHRCPSCGKVRAVDRA